MGAPYSALPRVTHNQTRFADGRIRPSNHNDKQLNKLRGTYPRHHTMSSRKYSDKQKLAYYKRLASARGPRQIAIRGTGAYKVSSKKKRPAKKDDDGSSSKAWYAPPDSVGSTIGGWLGHGAQKIVKALTGFGDYSIEANTILTGGLSPPEVINSVRTGGVIMRHREYIGDVIATTQFTNNTYDINPGLFATFPWLSQVAKAFELYRLRGLVFEFKSMSSDAVLSSSASSALGTVVMATQYNSLNPGFTSAIQMENHEFANASKPSCDFYHPVECKKSLIPAAELYIRDGAVPTGGDIRLFDIGQFNIATLGMQNATGVIGQLWCTYEVEFYQHAFTAPTTILSDHVFNTSCATGAICGASHSFSAGNSIGISFADSNSFQFPVEIVTGNFLVVMFYHTTGAAAAQVSPSFSVTAGSSLLQVWNDGTGPDTSNKAVSSNATSTTVHLAFILTIGVPNTKISFSGGTLSNCDMDLWVTQVDSDIST